MGNLSKALVVVSMIVGFAATGVAQTADISPTLVIESMPSDNPKYRRMVFVRYLNGASYKAYNRREFTNTPNASAQSMRACANGDASSLKDIRDFEQAEQRRSRAGQAPEPRLFCIKNIPNWEVKNKDVFLDPIFNGMPYLAQ